MSETADEVTLPQSVPPVRRGVYLRRHNARVIEDGNLLVVEFLDSEAVASARPGLHLPAWQVALRWGASLPARTLELLRLR